MKKITFISLFTLLISIAFGRCEDRRLSIFPGGKSIKRNSIFILEGLGLSQKIIDGLNTKYPIYLLGNGQRIKLKIKETYTGEFHLKQAFLIPQKLLKAGERYEVKIDNLPKEESLQYYNSLAFGTEPVVYEVGNDLDTSAPVFLSDPYVLKKEVKTDFAIRGCGTPEFVDVDMRIQDQTTVLVKARLTSLESGIETVCLILLGFSELKIGHNACNGPFKFDKGEKYALRLSVIDASGNETKWNGEPISIIRPPQE